MSFEMTFEGASKWWMIDSRYEDVVDRHHYSSATHNTAVSRSTTHHQRRRLGRARLSISRRQLQSVRLPGPVAQAPARRGCPGQRDGQHQRTVPHRASIWRHVLRSVSTVVHRKSCTHLLPTADHFRSVSYYRNCFTESNHIVYSDKDHQILYVDDRNTYNKSNMANGIHFGKSKKRHISANVWSMCKKFGMVTPMESLNPTGC